LKYVSKRIATKRETAKMDSKATFADQERILKEFTVLSKGLQTPDR
jgi:hypothetical protein